MSARLICFLLVGGCWVSTLTAAPSAPDWMASAVAAPVTVSTTDADAVVLLDDSLVEVDKDGSRTTRTRRVVRILTPDGRKYASGQVSYYEGSSSVKSLKAWLIKPSGEVVASSKKHIVDVARHLSALELYGEAREQQITPADTPAAGAVFGYESLLTEKGSILQLVCRFRESLPIQRSVFSVQLAEGWQARAKIFNSDAVIATGSGRARSWSLTASPGIPSEPMSAPSLSFMPWMAVDLLPPDKTREPGKFIPAGSWEEIAQFFGPRYDGAAQGNAAIKLQADKLVAGADSDWDRIRRLTRYVQDVNYISIQLDMANAGGYIPRPAPRVFERNYGDCKDKATLLRALLATQGLESFPLIVQAGEASRIQEEWPSPAQFNHCILAVKVSDRVQAPAVVVHPQLGRLLLIDATDENTPPGLLATPRLAGQGLLLAGPLGGLIELPDMRKEHERLVRRVTADLDEAGNLSGTIVEEYSGLASSAPRSRYVRLRKDDFAKMIMRWLGSTLPAVKTTRLEPVDDFDDGKFTLNVEFSAGGYGKMMRDKLLIFKPAIVSRHDSSQLSRKPRHVPLLIRTSAFREIAEITLPAGFEVDESPSPVDVKTEFGRYTSKITFKDGKLHFERELDLHTTEIPVTDYEKPRAFFERVLQSEQTPVVLRRVAADGKTGSLDVGPKAGA